MKVSKHTENISFVFYIILYNCFSFYWQLLVYYGQKISALKVVLPSYLSFEKKLFFLSIFQSFKNWVSKVKLEKSQKCSKCFQCKICNTLLTYCGKIVQFNKDFRTDGTHMSQKLISVFIKKLLKNTTLCGNSNACVSIRKTNIYYT